MNLSGFDFWRTRESVERLEACFGMCKKQDKKKTVLLAFSLISFADVIGHLWSLVLIVFDELVFVSVNGFHTFIANFSKNPSTIRFCSTVHALLIQTNVIVRYCSKRGLICKRFRKHLSTERQQIFIPIVFTNSKTNIAFTFCF